MQRKQKSLIAVLTFVLIILTTYAYSALATNLSITGEANFRVPADIRVTNILMNEQTGSTLEYEPKFTKDTITTGFTLSNTSSNISYSVTIKNNGLQDYAIYDFITQSSNNSGLIILIDGKQINQALPIAVPFGTTKTITITYSSITPGRVDVTNKFDFRKIYYVDYNLQGGSSTDDDLNNNHDLAGRSYGQIKYENVNLTLSNSEPTKVGYQFVGWNTQANGQGTNYTKGSTYTPNENKTLYAKWQEKTLTITLDNQDATTSGTATIYEKYNTGIYKTNTSGTLSNQMTTSANPITKPEKDGYKFGGYYTEANGQGIQYINENGYLTQNATTTQFKNNGTLYAKWTAYKLIINYYANGAQKDNNANIQNQKLTTDTYDYDGEDLKTNGLKNYDGGTGATWNLTKTGYSADKYWHVGSGSASKKVHENTKFDKIQDLATAMDKIDDFKTGDVEVNIYAGWTANNYKVRFNKNDSNATGEMSDESFTYDASAKALTKNVFTKTGYTFTGWNTLANGQGTAYTDEQSVQNLTTEKDGIFNLYAQWLANTYTVTLNPNGGSVSPTTKQVTYGQIYGTLPEPQREGYTFGGWFTDNTFETEITSSTTVTITDAQTIIAKWTSNTYTVTLNPNGGSVSPTSKTVTYDNAYGTLPDASKTGYTFKGWSLLPEGYKQVEYIQSNGTQYIDTGAEIFNKTSHEIVVDFEPTSFYNYNTIWGSTANADSHEGWIYSTGSLASRYMLVRYGTDNTIEINNRYKLDLIKNGNTIFKNVNNQNYSYNSGVSTSNGDETLLLFLSGTDYGKYKMYGSQVYSEGELVRDFVPCVQESTNKAGLYDVIEGVFYGDANGGTFTTSGSETYITSSSIVKTSSNHTLYAKYSVNELTFNNQIGSTTYNASNTGSVDIVPASNGTGSYTYTKVSEKKGTTNTNNFSITNNNKITAKANTPAGTYTIVVKATDDNSGATKEATYTITVNRQSVTVPICVSFTYNKTTQTLIESTTKYTASNNTGLNADDYTVTVTPTSNYKWSDGTTTGKSVSCTINPYDISGANSTIVPIASDIYTYDGSAKTPEPSIMVPLPTSSDSYTLTSTEIGYTYSNNTSAGTATVTATGTGNYTGTKSESFTINKATGYVTLDKVEENKEYSTTSATFNVLTHSGDLEVSDNNATATVSISGTQVTVSNISTLASGTEVVVTVTSKANTNYTVATETYTLRITDKPITGGSVIVTGNNIVGSTLTASVTNTTPVGTYTYQWYRGDTPINNATSSTYTVTSSDVASTLKVVVTSSKTNYSSISFEDTTDATNNKTEKAKTGITKPTTVKCTNPTYNAESQILTTSADTGYAFYDNSGIAATSYTVTAKLSNNYIWSNGDTADVTFNCSIAKKDVTVKADNQSKEYDGTALSANTSCTATGLLAAHTPSCTTSGTITDYAASGAVKTLSSVKIMDGTTDVSSNYNITKQNGTLTITKKAITITAKNQTVQYGTAISKTTSDVTVATLPSTDTLSSITLSQSKTAVSTDGKITATAAVIKRGTTDTTNNYTITYNQGSLTINKKNITASISSCSNKVYDGNTTASCGITLSGVQSGETATATATCKFDNKNVGTDKEITCNSFVIDGANKGNYNITTTSLTGSANITAKSITPTATASNKTYDGNANATCTISLPGIVSGDTVSSTYTGTFNNKNVGTSKAVTCSDIALTGTDKANYSLSTTSLSTTANVTAKSVAVSWTNVGPFTYNGSNQGPTATVNTGITGETMTVTATKAINKGTHTSEASCSSVTGSSACSNYTLTNTTKEFTINAQAVNPVTNLAVSTSGVVSWTASSNATGYQISIDGSTWTDMPASQTSYNYLSVLTATSANKTVYVRAINTDKDNYSTVDTGSSYAHSSNATQTVDVYRVDLNSNGYGIVSRDYVYAISGASFTSSGNILTWVTGAQDIATKIDKAGYTTTFSSWSPASGTISANTTITANFTRTANNYTLTANANGGSIVSTTGWTGTGNTSTKSVTYDSAYGTLPTVSRTGYTFKGWSLLPNGYKQVEYIESTGTQYIDTGYYWKHENIGIYFDGTVIANPSNQSLFGNEEYTTSSGQARNFTGIPHGLNGVYSIFIGSSSNGSVSPGLNSRFTLDIRTTIDKKLSVDLNDINKVNTTYSGSVMTHDTAYTTSTASTTVGNIFIFANHNSSRGASNAAIQNIGSMKLYSFKMIDNNELVRDFVPCVNESTGKAGLYDLVEGKFYGNSATSGNDFTVPEDEYFIDSTSIVNIPNNHNIYAKWTPVTYNLTYDLRSGSVSAANPATYNIETATFTLNNPTRSGYTFAGWTGSNGTTPQTSVSIAKGSTGDKSFTANWSKAASNLTVTLSQDSYNYDGTAKEPTVTVKDGTNTIPATEYDVTYSNNTAAGTASVKVTMKGTYNSGTKSYYTGSTTKTFTINKASISLPTCTTTYNKTEQTLLSTTSTYTVASSPLKGTNAGTYKVNVTPTANYKWSDGTTTAKEVTCTINQKELDQSKFTVGNNSKTYNGNTSSSITLAANATSGLISGDTVNVTYTSAAYNNANVASASSISVTGITLSNSNYKVKNTSQSYTGTITRANVAFPTCTAKTYNKSEQTLFDAHTSGSYTNSVLKATNAGTYTVALTPSANHKWTDNGGTTARDLSCTINKYNISSATVSTIPDHTYDNTVYKPTPSVTVPLPSSTNTYTLTDSEYDYSYSVASPKDVATYTVTMTAKEDTSTFTNNYTGSVSKTYKIVQANGYVNLSATTGSVTYGTTSKTFTVSSSHGGDLTVSDDNTTATSAISNGTVTIGSLGSLASGTKVKVTVTSAATTNYKEASATYELTITNAAIDCGTVAITGNNVVGEKLTASTTSTPSDVTKTYQWYTNTSDSVTGGTAINGATSSEFTLTSAQVGKYIYATITCSKTNYTTASASGKATTTSNKTATVKTKVAKPTAASYCANPIYNGTAQTITNTAATGYAFSNNSATNYSSTGYDVTASLSTNYIWSDYTTANTTINCNITRRAVTYKADSDSKTYNGTALTKQSATLTSGTLVSGHSATFSITGTQTNAGSSTNTLNSVTIKNGTTDVTANYNITKQNGTLTVNKADASCTISVSPTLTYPGATTGNITYSCTGDGTISVTSSDTSVITVGTVGTTSTPLTAKKIGSSTISVSRAAGTNYNAATAKTSTINVTGTIYSITLNNQSATSAGTSKVYYQYNTTKTVNGTLCYYYTDNALTTCLSSGYNITKPTKTGYTFGGYYTSTGGSGTQYVNDGGSFVNNIYRKYPSEINSSYTNDITLYAKWTPTSYTVTANANRGSIASTTGWTGTDNTSTKSVTYDAAYGTLPTVSRTGYTFKGWSLLPNGYKQVEYIESTGTQYIDTGYKPTPNTGVDTTYQFTSVSPRQQRIYGVSSDTNDTTTISYDHYINGSGQWAYAYKDGSGNWVSTRITADTNIHNFKFNVVKGKLIIDNGDTYNSTISGSPTNTSIYDLPIMAHNYNGTITNYAKMKLYSFKIYEDGELISDYIPCVNESTGKAGLYDLVEGKFYGNAATSGNDFTVPEEEYFIDSTSIVNIPNNHNIYAKWSANALTFANKTLNAGTYGTAYTSNAFDQASNGTGSYTYTIESGAPTGATINSTNRTISFTNSTAAGTYNVVVTATDNNSGVTKDATMSITINKVANPTTFTAVTGLKYGSTAAMVTVGSTQGTPYYAVGTELTASNYSTAGSTTIPTASSRNAGTYTIYYYIPEVSGKYNVKSGSVSVTIAKTSCPLTVSNGSMYTGATMTLSTRASNNVGTLSYALKSGGNNTTTASTISNGVLTAGAMSTANDNNQTVDVQITEAASTNYNSCTKDVAITVQKNTRTLSWSSTTPAANSTLTYGTSYSATASASGSGGTAGSITYASDNTSGATINSTSGAITVENGNSKAVTITATMARTATVAQATTTRAFTTGKANGYVNLSANSGSVTYGTASKSFTVSSSHGGTLSVSDNNSTASCAISGTTVTCSSLGSINAGTSITVTVTSAATDNYKEASKTYTLSITRAKTATTGSCINPTYNGSAQNIAGGGSNVTYSSNNSQTNHSSSNISVTVTPTSNYAWSDGTYAAKTLSCNITKATPVIALSSESGTINVGAVASTTATVKSGTSTTVSGTLTASSQPNTSGTPTVASVSPTSTSITNADNSTGVGTSHTITGIAGGIAKVSFNFTPTDTTNFNNAVARYYDVTVNNVVTVNIKKDDAAWSSSGMTVKLYQSGTLKYTLTTSGSSATVNNVAAGTYDIYASKSSLATTTYVDTGVDITVGSTNGSISTDAGTITVPITDNPVQDINYYVLTLTKVSYVKTVTGAGTYLSNESASIAATAFSTGYHFNGWTTTSGNTPESASSASTTVSMSQTTTLKANATRNTYSIAFNKNAPSGVTVSGTMSNLTSKNYGTSVSLTANAYSASGYTFVGWNTKQDGTGTAYLDSASMTINAALVNQYSLANSNGTITLYAQWISNGSVSITGQNRVGQTLTATVTSPTPTPTNYTYQWYRDSSEISGATSSTYTPVAADIGNTLKVVVTANYTNYNSVTFEDSTDATHNLWAKTQGDLSCTNAVAKVEGTATKGSTLTATVVTPPDPTPTDYLYQWFRGDAQIYGANDSTYTTTSDDVGQTIKVAIMGHKTYYNGCNFEDSIDETNNVSDTVIQVKATDLYYDNTNTGMTCETAQCALDHIERILKRESAPNTNGNNYLCKRATSSQLHNDSYSSTGKFGQVGTAGTLSAGDAFICDVNGDGMYNSTNEMFYYVSDYYNTTTKTSNTDYATLVYYNNVSAGAPSNTTSYKYYSSAANWYGPITAIAQLPTTLQWKDAGLSKNTRAILNESGGATTTGGSLPTSFSYKGYSGRLMTYQELKAACSNASQTSGSLDNCRYLVENSADQVSSYKNYWLENPYQSNSTEVWYVEGGNKSLSKYNASNSNLFGVRPVIEVKKTDIDYNSTGLNGLYTEGNNTYYYVNGVKQTGLQSINGTKYYFNSSGVMQTGWQQVSSTWYYFDTTTGRGLKGWQKISESWYYFNTDATMQHDRYQKWTDGYYYWLDTSGSSSTVAWNKAYSGNNCWVHKKEDTSDVMSSITYPYSNSDTSVNVTFDSSGWASTCEGW